jgi:ATP-dependent exoDNAse (exonuclease V) beta subunit
MIVDYKTDRVSGADLEQRTALYAGQLDEYRKAIQRITGKPVVESALVFLHPREIRRV